MSNRWQCGRFLINLNEPQVMGIVNTTPDSFSDGGTYSKNIASSLAHAEKLVKEGVDILDVGGESTRPGSLAIGHDEEWSRVAPILRELRQWQIPITLDTRHTVVMQKALEAELVDGINDVAALTDVGAVDLLAQYNNIGICLMHMQGLPDSMQVNPSYDDVLQEVGNYLLSRSQVCVDHGIQKSRLVLDPGFGFGKNLQHHIILMQNLDTMIKQSDFPWLIGVSRKRMLGEITGEDKASERVGASVAAALASIARGAHIVRVHDVKETKQAVQIWQAMGVFNEK